MYFVCTIYVQYMYNICTIYVQYIQPFLMFSDSVLKDYTKKKNEMEKYERNVNLISLNTQISDFKNQEIETSSTAKVKTV